MTSIKPFITFAILYLLLIPFCISQQTELSKINWLKNYAIEIKSIKPDNTNFSDLEPLKNVLKNVNIVLLGEQSHGGGSTYDAKVRMVKFLHQKMGFEVLAIESGMFDCAKIAEQLKNGSTIIQEKKNSIFYMYSNSKEVKHLFEYIDQVKNSKKPLFVTGMDSQHSGDKSLMFLIEDLEHFLNKNNLKIQSSSNWHIFSRKVKEIIQLKRNVSEEDKIIFYQYINELNSQLSNINITSEDLLNNSGFWLQIIASLESQAKRYWGDIEDMDRDRQMAINMSWLINNPFKGKKIIIWAHNFHIAKKVDHLKPMGYYLKNEFKDSMYALGFTGSNGSYIDFVSGNIVKIKSPSKNSIEGIMLKTSVQNAIIDFKYLPVEGHWLNKKQNGRFSNFKSQKAIYPEIFDGLFYIETTVPTKQE